ncbi:MAG: nucleotidyltransferase family protein [Chitinispirillaceae bacterium]|nr:nucleotidyltransferase family protein [Chitinispirillaceae bacterium]
MSHDPKWVALQIVYGEALAEIERLFASRGYCFMPIKGAYLIRSGLATTIASRCMRDIDLLLPEDRYSEICDWFESLPDVRRCPQYWDFERPVAFDWNRHSIYVELHRLVNTPNRFLLPNRQLFTHGNVVSESCRFPDPVDALLIHICHKLLHVIDGFELQFYREIPLYVQQEDFCWEVFWDRAGKTEIPAFIWLVIHKCNLLLHTKYYLPAAPSVYASFLARFDLFMRCHSPVGRRILYEIPFVRSVVGLAKYNWVRRGEMCRTNRKRQWRKRKPSVR